MHIQQKHKQLSWIGGLFCFVILLSGIIMLIIDNRIGTKGDEFRRESVAYVSAFIVSWLINLGTIVFIEPVLHRYSRRRWLIFYLPSYVLFIAVSACVWYGILTHLYKYSEPDLPLTEIATINTFVIPVIEFILFKNEEENTKLEIANYKMIILESQHEKLKNQLHPHFLFNALNALSGLIKRDPQQAENYLVTLSGFLRFSISHNEHNLVLLQEELTFSMYYLDMQKTRFKNALLVTVDIPEHLLSTVQLPVFSLQLLLENAIKHNVLTVDEPLHITVAYCHPNRLLVRNNFNPVQFHETNKGFGLKNLSERYKLLTEQDIQVEQTAHIFQVYLTTIPV